MDTSCFHNHYIISKTTICSIYLVITLITPYYGSTYIEIYKHRVIVNSEPSLHRHYMLDLLHITPYRTHYLVIWPCPCTGTGPNFGLYLYMDRAEYGPVNLQYTLTKLGKKVVIHLDL
jgi:hypothetical protein